MKTFECPKCGGPVTYDPNMSGGTGRCAYCQSQLSLPDEMRGQPARIIPEIDINISPQIATGAKKVISLIASGLIFNDKNKLLIVSRSKVMKFALNQ